MPTNWTDLFTAPNGVRSISCNAENPSGAPGAGGHAASNLGPGRKGAPSIAIKAGETATLMDVEGPGVVRHIWVTVPDRTAAGPWVLRDLVLRAYWDGSDVPAVEVPLGDFFCNGFGARALVTSEPIVVAPTGGMNSYFQMPFHSAARITLENQHPGDVEGIYYQVDGTIGDDLPDDALTFHARWHRSNGSTAPGEDHLILDTAGAGRYVGTYVALTALERYWWGEGETKFFIDQDTDHPSQTSTGLEDYAGGAWAFQDGFFTDRSPVPITFSAPYCGYPYYSAEDTSGAAPFTLATPQSHGMYRWHLPDPVIFSQRIRVTLQQIGAWDYGLFERADDISTTSYWYQTPGATNQHALDDRSERRPR